MYIPSTVYKEQPQRTNIYIYQQQVELLYLSSKKKTNKHTYHVEIRPYFIETMH